ncbi:MAG: hypothetical protein ABIR32_00910 [Ilumatobacteraceae bacterium]
MKQPCPRVRLRFAQHGVRRRAVSAAIAVVLPLAMSACSDESSDGSSATAAAGPSATTPNGDSASAESAASATSAGAVTDPAPAETSAPQETAAVPDAGDCSMVPGQDVVESIIAAKVLPVEFQEFAGCAYLGDANNVGVYFEIDTDEQDIASFPNPDPQFAVTVQDPGLPPGSFVQSGDLFAMKNGVLYTVSANVTGTADDDALATQLMVAWLALLA